VGWAVASGDRKWLQPHRFSLVVPAVRVVDHHCKSHFEVVGGKVKSINGAQTVALSCPVALELELALLRRIFYFIGSANFY
jgi:hypothetical protein